MTGNQETVTRFVRRMLDTAGFSGVAFKVTLPKSGHNASCDKQTDTAFPCNCGAE